MSVVPPKMSASIVRRLACSRQLSESRASHSLPRSKKCSRDCRKLCIRLAASCELQASRQKCKEYHDDADLAARSYTIEAHFGKLVGGSAFFAGIRCTPGLAMAVDIGCQNVAMTSVDMTLSGSVYGA